MFIVSEVMFEEERQSRSNVINATQTLDVSFFEKNFIGYGSPKKQTVELKQLMNIALAKLGESPVRESVGFSESDVEKIKLIRSRFSIDPKTGAAVQLSVENKLEGVRDNTICGLVTAQILFSLAGRKDKIIPFERFKKLTGGRWDRSQLLPGEPEWLVSDYPIPPEIRSGQKYSEFHKTVRGIGNQLGVPADWLLAVMAIESGLSPLARHPYSDARGYLQFIPSVRAAILRRGVPFTPDPIKQLKVVEAYLLHSLNGKSQLLRGPEDIYTLVLGPGFLGRETLYSIAKTPQAYKMNNWLDIDRSGAINRPDLRRVIQLYWPWR